jgi:hypothetical protein
LKLLPNIKYVKHINMGGGSCVKCISFVLWEGEKEVICGCKFGFCILCMGERRNAYRILVGNPE